jgi:hypothetical protein
MITAIIAFMMLTLLLAFAFQVVSKFTLREYKLAFKVGLFAAASLLILFVIINLF